MLTLEPLHSLVQSLTKTEKRYFTMSHNRKGKGKKDYLHLFDILDHATEFSEELLGKIKDAFPGTSIEPARKHLYQILMRTLRQFQGDRDVEVKLGNLLQDSRILYNKGLISASFNQLDKVKKVAMEHEKFPYYILAARQQLYYHVLSQFAGMTEAELIEEQQRINNILQQQVASTEQYRLYEILLLRYWSKGLARSQKEIVALNDLLLEEHHMLTTHSLSSFESKQLHLQFQSTYFFISGNPEGSLSVFRDLETLFYANQTLWEDNPTYYVQLVNGILNGLRSMERYDELPYYYKKLERLKIGSDNLQLIARYTVFSHIVHSYADQNLFNEGSAFVKERSKEIKSEVPLLPILMQSEIQLGISRIAFEKGDYSLVLKIVNKQLDQLSKTVSSKHPLYIVFQLMHLQVNILLKNDDYLYYAIRTMERKLKSERKLYGVEELLLRIAKKWIRDKRLEGIEEMVNALTDNPFENQMIKTLAIRSWLPKVSSISVTRK